MTRRYTNGFLLSVISVVISLLPLSTLAALSVTATFNQSGISGTIRFTQETPDGNTTIDVNLTGLELSRFPSGAFPFPWHVHEYPFPHDGTVTPCGGEITGGHFDPLGAAQNSNYDTDCSMQSPQNCEIGDLSGKFGGFPQTDPLNLQYNDSFLSLYGVNSIIGRSIVIHFANGSRLVCANIGYPTSVSGLVLYSPFRNSFKGDIFFRQHTPDNSTSSVYTNLERVGGDGANSTLHNWHVHNRSLDATGMDCMVAGPHYNPRDVNISDPNYAVNCGNANATLQRNCEIGDLSSKGAPFDVLNRRIRQFYTDTDLPVLPDVDGYSIDGLSTVIHAENRGGPRIDCANLTQYQPLAAISVFNDQGVSGSVRFYQRSPYDQTQVSVSLRGLQRRFDGYHVHEYPVGPPSLGSPGNCGAAFTGGHWNPTNISTRGRTSDHFEIGDLSGKFGGLSGLDEISANYTDPNVPLFGPFSVIGRSIVIHLDQDGSRSLCSDIQRTRQILQIVTNFTSDSFSGSVTFSQLADDPYAETTITVAIVVNQMLQPPPVVVSSSTPLEVTPTTTTMATTTVATTEFLEASSSVATIMTTNPITMTMTSSVMMTSSSVSLLQPFTSSAAQELPTSVTSQLEIRPEPTPISSPSPSPSPLISSTIDVGSGGNSLLMPFSDEVTVEPTNLPSGRRRRGVDEGRRLPRQTDGDSGMAVPFEWSLRVPPTQGSPGAISPADCDSLTIVDAFPSNTSLCSPTNQLACSAGDLTSKHGLLLLPQMAGTSLRAVFTDSNLPLSGPGAVFQRGSDSNPLLLIQQMGGAMMSSRNVVCERGGAAVLVDAPTEPPPPNTMAPPTMPVSTTVGNTPVPSQKDNTAVIIGAAVGGSVGLILLILLLVIIAVCVKRRNKNHYNLAKTSKIELGTINPSKPIIGIPNYKVLYNYKPQNEGDLQLAIGDWVTLKETPYGGDWWRGAVEGKGEGWFPKNYVKYVDVEAEKKKREAENFKLAAAAIVAASTSFSTRHPSLSRKKRENTEVDAKPKRAQTFSRRDIDSTPKMVTKLDKPYLQDTEPPPDGFVAGMVIANSAPGSVGGSQPGTPASQRSASEVITNKVAMETGSSQEDNNEANVNKELETLNVSAEFLISEKYLAKYEFGGSTDIELRFKKGNVVTVIEKAENGWWKGICEGQVGWFPESYVRPAPKAETTKPESNHAPNATTSLEERQQVEQPRGMDEMMASGDDLEASEYRAVFSYESETQGDLRFSEGETVLVYWADENGWWFGSAGSAQGWFPGSYVEPVVESSEAGSVLASPVQLTQEEAGAEGEEDGNLASQLTAAIKKRKTKKEKGGESGGEEKDSRSSFRKRWSLRRKSRDKNKGSPSANRAQESPSQKKEASVSEAAAVSGAGEGEGGEMELGGRDAEIASPDNERLLPNSNEGGDIQNELASAIVRRNSIGREATLSIDERLAKAKQDKESEPQNELLKALKKRKASTEQSSNSMAEKSVAPAETLSPTEKAPVVLENSNTATGSSQEDNQAPEEPATNTADSLAPPTKEPEERKEEKTAATSKMPEEKKEETSKTPVAEQKAAPVISSPPQEPPPRRPEAKTRKSTVAGRPKRRPPPPPVGGATAAPQPAGGTANTPQPAASPVNKLSPQAAQPSPKVRKTSAPSPLIHERAKPAPGQEADKKPHPSRTAPETDKSGRSYTTAATAALGGKGATQPKGKLRPVKRQATAGDLKPKYPARRPPPPPPGTLTSPPVKQPGKPSPSSIAKKAEVTESKSAPAGGSTPQQQGKKAVPPSQGTPVAPPRAKARVQKVKRPISRMIPPPPNIPLPPPPVRTTPPTANKNKTEPQTSSAPSPPTPQNASTPPVKVPRPRGPKPAPPARVSSLTPEPLKKLRLTPQAPPTISEATTAMATTESKTAVSTKPTTPPTRRDKLPGNDESSSAKTTAPVPAKRQQLPSSSEEVVKEETDSPLVTDSPLNRKATKSAPPERPPPPRPPSAASNTSSKIGQVNPADKTDKSATKPSQSERPPPSSIAAGSPTTKRSGNSSDAKQGGGVAPLLSSSNQGKVLFDASTQQQQQQLGNAAAMNGDSGNDIKSRGGGFMKSLKKMVKRDSGTTDSSSSDHKTAATEANSNKTPPTKRTSTKKADTPQDSGTAAEPKSPPARPPPVSKTDHSSTAAAAPKPLSPNTKENGATVTEQPKSPPARPPPVLSQEPKVTTAAVTTEPKPPPSRPPPRKISTSEQVQVKHEVKQELSVEPKATEPNPPPPRKVSSEQPQAKREAEQKAAEKKGEAVAVVKEKPAPLSFEVKSEPVAPKPRPRKAEVADEKAVEKKTEEPVPPAKREEKKETKMVASGIPSRPPPPRTSPSEKRKISIPSRPPPPKTPVNKSSSNSLEQQNGPKSPGIKTPTSATIPEKPKPMPAPRKESQSDLLQKSNGTVNSAAPAAPVPTPRQKSSSPTPGGEMSPTNPTGTSFYRALKDYEAAKDGELSFSAGDVLIFIDRREKGFYYGMLDNGSTGLFPTSHVEPFFR